MSLANFPSLVPATRLQGATSCRDPHRQLDGAAAVGEDDVISAWHGTIQVMDRSFRLVVTHRRAPAPAGSSDGACGPLLTTFLAADSQRASASHPAAHAGDQGQQQAEATNIHIQSEASLAELMAGHEAVLKQFWRQSPDVNRFLLELTGLIVRPRRRRTRRQSMSHPRQRLTRTTVPACVPSGQSRMMRSSASTSVSFQSGAIAAAAAGGRTTPSAFFFSALAKDIAQIDGGWSRVKRMDEKSCRGVTLAVVDIAGREHLMEVELPELYPLSDPIVSCDLPLPLDTLPSAARAASSSSSSPLSVLYTRFRNAVVSYQLLWDLLDDIDRNSWVLEPEWPRNRKDTHRRIAIAASLSLEFRLDPASPLSLPPLRFFGPDSLVKPLQATVSGNDDDIPSLPRQSDLLRRNLLHVLDRDQLPMPTSDNRDEFNLECHICATYRLEELIPDVSCPTPSCQRSFHRPCLVEWLQSLADTQDVFGSLHGDCPQCRSKIVVRK